MRFKIYVVAVLGILFLNANQVIPQKNQCSIQLEIQQ